MDSNISFMPLGGGQSVGASCYFLKLGDANIILDAGIGKKKDLIFQPDIYSLVTSPLIESMCQINQIFISHAHIDHVGYLLDLMKDTPKASIYMTEITALLTEYQLYDKNFIGKTKYDEQKRLSVQYMLKNITKVGYMQTMDFGKYKVSFLPAGHISGAMMTLFQFGKRNILYTGDYSLDSTPLTDGCILPDNIKIDTVIMCGLHAKHPQYMKNCNKLYKTAKTALYNAKQNKSVVCYVSQLSKGIEFIKTLNSFNKYNIPVYIDKSVMNIVNKMENLSIPILNENNRVMGLEKPDIPHIFVTAQKTDIQYDEVFYIDFSLHEDFNDMKAFITKINPKQVILVHCAKENSVFDKTIEQEVLLNSDCNAHFIFAEQGEIYRL